MSFSLAGEFAKYDYTQWLDIVGSDLKLGLNGEDVEKKLNTKSLEGLVLSPLGSEEQVTNLKTFPEHRDFYKQCHNHSYFHNVKNHNVKNQNEKGNFQDDLNGNLNTFFLEVEKELPEDLSFLNLDVDAIFMLKLSDLDYIEKNIQNLKKIKNKKVSVLLDPILLQLKSNKTFEDVIKTTTKYLEANSQVHWLIDASPIHNAGASMVQEIAYLVSGAHRLLANDLISNNVKRKIYFRVACDSVFFGNIAKLRAFRFIWERILEEYQVDVEFEILATSSMREQTLYDPWVNILRNVTSSFASFLGGANAISAVSYDEIFEHLTKHKREMLGARIARNSLHILSQESHLDKVKDPLRGSYSVEDMTRQLIHGAWQLFLEWEKEASIVERLDDFSHEVKAIALSRMEKIRKRKMILTGINNFANASETISSLYQYEQKNVFERESGLFPIRRLASEFEQLRMDYEKGAKKVVVYIATYGDPAKLSARINFVRNYFELLGIQVKESNGKNLSDENHLSQLGDASGDASIVVLCALDEDYPLLLEKAKKSYSDRKVFIAGKFANTEIQSLYQGQDVYQVLAQLVEELCK